MDNKIYFKITNANENHQGFQYVNGLNVLDKPFEEEGSCVKGGLYFSDMKHILKFLSYGIYLREITLPHTDPDFKMVKDPEGEKYRANKIILGKRYNLSDVSTYEYLISLGVNVNLRNSHLVMRHASTNGYLEIIKFLIEKKLLHSKKYMIEIQIASEVGHLEVVKYLVEKGADFRCGNDYPIQLASKKGHLEIVKFLFEQGADFKCDNDLAIRWAAEDGHLEVVKFLVENGANFKASDNIPLTSASKNGHLKVAEFLMECIKSHNESIIGDKKYFKITNALENHNGFQYVDGLNILDKPFQEEGSCVKGGLYFSDAENILKFIDYGIYLREITFPLSDPDFKIVKDPENDKWRCFVFEIEDFVILKPLVDLITYFCKAKNSYRSTCQ